MAWTLDAFLKRDLDFNQIHGRAGRYHAFRKLAGVRSRTTPFVRGENSVISWIVRLLMAVAGIVAAWFIAKDALNFGIVQAVIALLLVTLIVAVLALRPICWAIRRNLSRKTR